jgi:uncharacterized protein with GYD domain
VNGLRKNKAFALLSVIVAATVFGVLVFSVSASEDVTSEEETAPVFCGFRNRWLDTLTDEQRATLQEMIEENRAEVKAQLEEWGVKISELDDEQREILKTMIEENQAEVKEQLEAWGIEIPVLQGPMGWQDSLTDEQLEELKTMRQEYLDAVKAKLEEWGIEIPEVPGPRAFDMGFRGRGFSGFGLLKP